MSKEKKESTPKKVDKKEMQAIMKKRTQPSSFRRYFVLLSILVAYAAYYAYGVYTAPKPDPETQKFESLMTWLQEGNAQIVNSLKLADSSMDDVRGVYTTKGLTYGTRVMAIPMNRLITVNMCKDYEVGRKYEASTNGKPDWIVQLSIVLVEEMRKGKDSIWFPYLNILPKSLEYFPMFFNDELNVELKGSQILKTVAGRRQLYRNYYDSVKSAAPEFDCTFDHFVYCLLLVNSRNFGIEVHGKHMSTLVPLADMLNHEMPPAPTGWQFDNKLNAFTVVVTTSKGISAMTAVHDSYGHKCNNRLFAGYGFTLHNNPANTALVDLNGASYDKEHYQKLLYVLDPSGNYFKAMDEEKRIELLKGYDIKNIQVQVGYKEETTQSLFGYLRYFAHEIDGTKKYTQDPSFSITKLGPVSVEIEKIALERLKKVAEIALNEFHTTLEQDKELAQKRTELDSNMNNILTMRMGEKEILHWLISLADYALPLLDAPKKEIERLSKLKDANDERAFNYYVKSVILPLKQ